MIFCALHPETPELTRRKIVLFWLPLFASWLMMGLEGPFIAAIIARVAEAKFNLAAYGVAFSLGMLFESPIIMMLSAANALVRDRLTYLKLRRFNVALNMAITLAMLIVLLPPVFFWLTRNLIGLPPEVARLTHQATFILLPWPAAIGFRRFYQGILIGNGMPRRVAHGTVVRLASMAATALLLYLFSSLPGACVGTAALSAGVIMEALASRLMAGPLLRRILDSQIPASEPGDSLRYRQLAFFYFPLAMTSVLALAVHPLMSFFLGKSRLPIESLAVLPVVNALVFIFRSAGLSFQEAAIALLGHGRENDRRIASFAWLLALVASGILLLIAFSPAVICWFHGVSGLPMELARLAVLPIRILVVMPALTVLLSFQRSHLVKKGKTRPITVATAIEVAVIAGFLLLAVARTDLVGVTAAALAAVSGRLCAIAYLQLKARQEKHALTLDPGA
jgi:Na+-driven multidrug efflux pump